VHGGGHGACGCLRVVQQRRPLILLVPTEKLLLGDADADQVVRDMDSPGGAAGAVRML